MEHISISSIVTRLGTSIVLPVIFLVPVGFFIDRTYGSLPFATIAALTISACVSSVWVLRMVKQESNKEVAE